MQRPLGAISAAVQCRSKSFTHSERSRSFSDKDRVVEGSEEVLGGANAQVPTTHASPEVRSPSFQGAGFCPRRFPTLYHRVHSVEA